MTSANQFREFVPRLRQFIRLTASGAPATGNFEDLALELFALQFLHNAPYRRFCEARNSTPQAISHWTRIPALPTTAFKELELSCFPIEERVAIFYSSGTTGQRPSRHYHSAASLKIYEESLLPWFQKHLLPNSPLDRTPAGAGRLAILTPPLAQAPHSSLVYMAATIARATAPGQAAAFLGRVTRDDWRLNLEGVVQTLTSAVAEAQPVLLFGTAFSFIHLLDHLVQFNLRFALPRGSRALETGGYKGRSRSLPKSQLHSLLTERLGLPRNHIICEYGMSELSSQAYDRVAGDKQPLTHSEPPLSNKVHAPRYSPPTTGYFRFPPWARVQIVSPETGHEVAEGETGLIRVFDLANVYSVMAIQTEDLGIRRRDGFELLGRAALAEPRGCSLLAT